MIRLARWILLPFSAIYAFIIFWRNLLYDIGVFSSKTFPINSIVIGNLAIGGSGKSPMTEYLIRILNPQYKIATLSRGYGRKTKGFRLVQETDDVKMTGDEPLQFKKKYPHITVAVCERRQIGIETLSKNHNLIILDDAFQHRKISAKINLLLFDYQAIISFQLPLPTGNLRDLMNQTKRADIVLISKCPQEIDKNQQQLIELKIKKYGDIPIFYSRIKYMSAKGLSDKSKIIDNWQNKNILLVTGIANPLPLQKYLNQEGAILEKLTFSDHHNYKEADYQKITSRYELLTKTAPNAIILTTEKDAQRLDLAFLPKLPIFQIPIEFEIENKQLFEQLIFDKLN